MQDLTFYSNSEQIMIIDSACDQTVVNNISFVINSYTGVFFNVSGAIKSSKISTKLELVNDCYTLVKFPNNFIADNTKIKSNLHVKTAKPDACMNKIGVIFKLNQALLNTEPGLKESLLQPYEARANGVIIDDVPTRYTGNDSTGGTQRIVVNGDEIPLFFDGWKCYLNIRKPTQVEIRTLPVYEITSRLPYKPDKNNHGNLINIRESTLND